MRFVTLSLISVLLMACGGSGSRERNGRATSTTGQKQQLLNQVQVQRAFRAAGLRRPHGGLLGLFEDSGLAKRFGITTWDSDPASTSPSVTVERFSAVRLARYAVAAGGNIPDGKNGHIQPFARIANVVVTVDPNASRDERVRVLRAIRSLRVN